MNGELDTVRGVDNADPGAGLLRLLVVDDDPLGQTMMDLMLSPHGYHLEFASDGQEALKAIQAGHYDLVFMDLILPDMNGMDVSRRVREWEAGQGHVPIVAITAYDLPGQPLEMIKAGLDDYIFKPYDLRGLRRIIQLYASGQGRDAADPVRGEQLATPADAPVLDYKSSLADLSGDAAGYRGLLKDFLASLPGRLGRMVEAHAAGDYERLGRETHSLKGIAAGLGASKLSRLAAYAGYCCASERRSEVPDALQQLMQAAAELQEEARGFLASRSESSGS